MAAPRRAGSCFADTSFFRNYQTWSDQVVEVSTAPGVKTVAARGCRWMATTPRNSPRTTAWASIRKIRQTTAGYAQLSFKHDKWDGNVGVRFVKTEARGSGQLVFSQGNFGPGAPADDVAFANGASVETSGTNSYDDVLPSFNLRYKASDNFFLRFAVAKGIARPEFPQLLPSITINPQVGSDHGRRLRAAAPGRTRRAIASSDYNGFAGNADLSRWSPPTTT